MVSRDISVYYWNSFLVCLTCAYFVLYIFTYEPRLFRQRHAVTRCGDPCVKSNTNVGPTADQCHVGVLISLAILCPSEMAHDRSCKLAKRRKLLGIKCFCFSVVCMFVHLQLYVFERRH